MPLLGIRRTGNSGASPGRPRRCNRGCGKSPLLCGHCRGGRCWSVPAAMRRPGLPTRKSEDLPTQWPAKPARAGNRPGGFGTLHRPFAGLGKFPAGKVLPQNTGLARKRPPPAVLAEGYSLQRRRPCRNFPRGFSHAWGWWAILLLIFRPLKPLAFGSEPLTPEWLFRGARWGGSQRPRAICPTATPAVGDAECKLRPLGQASTEADHST